MRYARIGKTDAPFTRLDVEPGVERELPNRLLRIRASSCFTMKRRSLRFNPIHQDCVVPSTGGEKTTVFRLAGHRTFVTSTIPQRNNLLVLALSGLNVSHSFPMNPIP